MRYRLSRVVFPVALVIWTAAATPRAGAAPADEPVVYAVKFPAPNTHIAEVEATVPTQAALKWPNDLLLPARAQAGPALRKAAGILSELELAGEEIAWAVLGMGVNVNWVPQGVVDGRDLAEVATSVSAAAGGPVDHSKGHPGLPLESLLLDYGVRLLFIGLAAWWGARWLSAPMRRLTQASQRLEPLGMRVGFHNHKPEFVASENGQRPMDILAADTSMDVVLQLDVGACLDAGADPVAWIKANPGRIKSMHCKDWTQAGGTEGYRVLLGEGAAPWAKICEAAESAGGIEFYLIEQEGSRFPPLETAARSQEPRAARTTDHGSCP